MSSELIERLREKNEWTNQKPYFHAHPKSLEAADLIAAQAATIAQLQAELAEAREVPGRIVDWLRGEVQYHRKHPEDQAFARHIATAIEAHDWSKP